MRFVSGRFSFRYHYIKINRSFNTEAYLSLKTRNKMKQYKFALIAYKADTIIQYCFDTRKNSLIDHKGVLEYFFYHVDNNIKLSLAINTNNTYMDKKSGLKFDLKNMKVIQFNENSCIL